MSNPGELHAPQSRIANRSISYRLRLQLTQASEARNGGLHELQGHDDRTDAARRYAAASREVCGLTAMK
ncbi:hypothetical protein ACQW08_04535 [Gluconobacter japonicus]|uniref:hypothetical protein n=1 Tax=Gluconobacter japonicus TaxID=376620 RepID=UPI003D282214